MQRFLRAIRTGSADTFAVELLLAGVPVLMLSVYMLFMAPKGIGALYLLVWLFVLYLGNSILTLSQYAWGATLATQYHERSRVFGVLTAVGVAAGVITLLIPIVAPPGSDGRAPSG